MPDLFAVFRRAPAFAPALPLPADREIWQEAAGWAAGFWAELAESPLVLADFAGLARARAAA